MKSDFDKEQAYLEYLNGKMPKDIKYVPSESMKIDEVIFRTKKLLNNYSENHMSLNEWLKCSVDNVGVDHSMNWISVEDKHFVDILYSDTENKHICGWTTNENTPNGTFLVGSEVGNAKTRQFKFEWYRVIMTDDDIMLYSDENDFESFGWSISDIQYWMEIKEPNNN